MVPVILAAGLGTRFLPFTELKPKCLLEFKNRTIIAHLLANICGCGFKKAVIVVGYKSELIIEEVARLNLDITIEYVFNAQFATTNTAYSLWLAKEFLREGFISIHSDLIFERAVLDGLVRSKEENAIVVDRRIRYDSDAMKINEQNNQILEMSKTLDVSKNCGTAIGVYKFSVDGAQLLLEEIESRQNQLYYNTWISVPITNILHKLKITPNYIDNLFWADIDNFDDLLSAIEEYDRLNNLEKRKKDYVWNNRIL